MHRIHRLAIAALLAVSSCSSPTGVQSELATARARWNSERPTNYEYTLRLSCFCGQEVTSPVLIRVSGNTVVSRTYVSTGGVVASSFVPSFPTVDGLFEIILEAARRNASQIHATYDDDLGYPRQVNIDYIANAADDEINYTASGLRAIP